MMSMKPDAVMSLFLCGWTNVSETILNVADTEGKAIRIFAVNIIWNQWDKHDKDHTYYGDDYDEDDDDDYDDDDDCDDDSRWWCWGWMVMMMMVMMMMLIKIMIQNYERYRTIYQASGISTHWENMYGSMIYAIIDSDNGWSPDWHPAIIRTSFGILLIRPLIKKFSEMSSKITKYTKRTWKCCKMKAIMSRPQCISALHCECQRLIMSCTSGK